MLRSHWTTRAFIGELKLSLVMGRGSLVNLCAALSLNVLLLIRTKHINNV